MKPATLLAALSLAAAFAGCQSLPMPKGTSKGYSSVRLVRPDPNTAPSFSERKAEANRMVQNALASEFRSHGFRIDPNTADLVVAYLIIAQNNIATTSVNDYFGYGRAPMDILDAAHTRGVLKQSHADHYEAGAIVVDILDAQTNKLVYRNFAKRNLIPGLSPDQRQQRVNEAVREALAGFFR